MNQHIFSRLLSKRMRNEARVKQSQDAKNQEQPAVLTNLKLNSLKLIAVIT